MDSGHVISQVDLISHVLVTYGTFLILGLALVHEDDVLAQVEVVFGDFAAVRALDLGVLLVDGEAVPLHGGQGTKHLTTQVTRHLLPGLRVAVQVVEVELFTVLSSKSQTTLVTDV